MYFNNMIWLLSRIYPVLEWSVSSGQKKEIYLTFDDGPVPGPTDFVLEQLREYGASATFFCVGDNVRKYPSLLHRIQEEGHRCGNHTYNHLNGWKTPDPEYLANVQQCADIFLSQGLKSSEKMLFRPPYGKISPAQIKALQPQYRIIMWNVLTGDYDAKLSPDQCLNKALTYTKSGSIVIFHDSYKAEPNMRYALPRFLRHFSELGYVFKTL